MSDTAEKTEARLETMSFEDAMEELNGLVEKMEDGKLPLESAITAYQRGVKLVQLCTAQLEKVDQQIAVLDKDMLKPFEPDTADAAS